MASIVLEQASQLGEIGAGIQIAPNAFHCFDRLGLGDEARRVAVYIDMLRLMDGVTGDEICNIPLGDAFRARFRNPYAVVHRADLHGAILDACRSTGLVELRTNAEVVGYDHQTAGVTVQTCDGQRIDGAALVGADGINSTIRQAMIKDGPPRVSGHTTYRSVIATERMPEDLRWNAATLWAGPTVPHRPLPPQGLEGFQSCRHLP